MISSNRSLNVLELIRVRLRILRSRTRSPKRKKTEIRMVIFLRQNLSTLLNRTD